MGIKLSNNVFLKILQYQVLAGTVLAKMGQFADFKYNNDLKVPRSLSHGWVSNEHVLINPDRYPMLFIQRFSH